MVPLPAPGQSTSRLNALQKLFLLRSCSDSFFNNRDRPCLLYQIKRCSAPCVDRIDKAGYAELVADAKAFLGGKSTAVQAKLAKEMEGAAEALDFERAAMVRDRLKALTFIQGSPGDQRGRDWRCRYLCARAQAGGDRHPGLLHSRRAELGPPRVLPCAHAGCDRGRSADTWCSRNFTTKCRLRQRSCSTVNCPRRTCWPRRWANVWAKSDCHFSATRRPDKAGRAGEAQCRGSARPAAGGDNDAGQVAARSRRPLRTGRTAATDRDLRQQPYSGNQCSGRDGGCRAGRLYQKPVSQMEHQTGRNRR